MCVRALVSLVMLLPLTALVAAEQPLGALAAVDDVRLTLAFDTSVQLPVGLMVAIYAPAGVEKHPLTGQVMIEERALAAKAQILGGAGATHVARLVWKSEGAELGAGFDCVPMPAEAAPNAPPAVGALADLQCVPGGLLTIQPPVSDPDGDPLTCIWSLGGKPGTAGRLSARTSGVTPLLYRAPLVAGQVTIHLQAMDDLGQSTEVDLPVTVTAAEPDHRGREPGRWSAIGEDLRPGAMCRDQSGDWWLHDGAERTIRHFAPGWTAAGSFDPGEDAPREPLAIEVRNDLIYVLDGSSRSVQTFSRLGKRRSSFGSLSRPTDLVLGEDGTLFVADQGAGGVIVLESDGSFRCRLGQSGTGKDAFEGLVGIALGPLGELYCLDAAQRHIQRFDRFGHRLSTWQVQGDPKTDLVDIAVHPRGVLVLMASGLVQIFNADGLAKEAFPAPNGTHFRITLSTASKMLVDADGEVYIGYPSDAALARLSPEGVLTGIRSAYGVSSCTRFVQDGRGRIFGLDPRRSAIHVFDGEGFLTARAEGLAKELSSLAVVPDGSLLYALDNDKLTVLRFDPEKLADKPLAIGQRGTNNGQFKTPSEIVADEAGRLYVLDGGLHRISVFDREGKFQFTFGRYDKGKASDEMLDPRLLAVAPAGDAAYVYDYDRYEVKKFTLDQQVGSASFVTNMGGKGDAPGQIRRLGGLSCDRSGLIYLLDVSREDLQVADFRGGNAVVVQTWKFDKPLRTTQVEHFSAGPDGLFLFGPSGSVSIFAW